MYNSSSNGVVIAYTSYYEEIVMELLHPLRQGGDGEHRSDEQHSIKKAGSHRENRLM